MLNLPCALYVSCCDNSWRSWVHSDETSYGLRISDFREFALDFCKAIVLICRQKTSLRQFTLQFNRLRQQRQLLRLQPLLLETKVINNLLQVNDALQQRPVSVVLGVSCIARTLHLRLYFLLLPLFLFELLVHFMKVGFSLANNYFFALLEHQSMTVQGQNFVVGRTLNAFQVFEQNEVFHLKVAQIADPHQSRVVLR